MYAGKRRTIFQDRLAKEVLPAFAGRVLPFDLAASQAYADLMAREGGGPCDWHRRRLHCCDGCHPWFDDRNAQHQSV